MGAGIAQVFAGIGANVVVVESDDSAADAAGTRLDAGLRLAAERGTLDGSLTDAQRRVRIVTDITELPSDSALVIEAVPEVGEMKVRVLTAAERAVSSDTVLASNTSSLSIGELGSVLVRPERFLGMHFFNPVPVSTLVEVVLGPNTGERTQRRALDWIALLGKTPVLVKDSPGFATSRLGVMLGLEAIRTLQEGVADAESIDRAMELGYGHPMGPLRSTDLVGLDVRLAIAEHLWQTLGDRFAPPKLLREKVARGELGRKTGTGFYSWPSP